MILIPNTYTDQEKIEIAKQCKNISNEDAVNDFNRLKKVDFFAKSLSTIGNKTVDRFTFLERKNTISKRGFNFFDLYQNRELYINKNYIRKLLNHNVNKSKIQLTIDSPHNWEQVMNIYFSAINIFRPRVAGNIYARYEPTCILDPTMGWGGRLIGAMALNIPHYIGIDNNLNLQQPYNDMVEILQPHTATQATLIFEDALTIDYSQFDYDMVLTSPPYFNIEVYNGKKPYDSQNDWINKFYEPLFKMTYDNMKKGGHYCLNIPIEIYEAVCIPLFGEATHFFELHKTQRDKTKKGKLEFIYIWIKCV